MEMWSEEARRVVVVFFPYFPLFFQSDIRRIWVKRPQCFHLTLLYLKPPGRERQSRFDVPPLQRAQFLVCCQDQKFPQKTLFLSSLPSGGFKKEKKEEKEEKTAAVQSATISFSIWKQSTNTLFLYLCRFFIFQVSVLNFSICICTLIYIRKIALFILL